MHYMKKTQLVQFTTQLGKYFSWRQLLVFSTKLKSFMHSSHFITKNIFLKHTPGSKFNEINAFHCFLKDLLKQNWHSA